MDFKKLTMKKNYSKINQFLFVFFNLIWALLILPINLYGILSLDSIFNWMSMRFLCLTLILAGLQIIGYYKLKHGNIFYALAAVYVLSFIIDLDGFKLYNTLLLNIDLLYTSQGDFVFDLRLFQGPYSNWNVRLSDLEFRQIGFNAVGLIQIYFLLGQESLKLQNSDEENSNLNSGSELVTN